MDLRREIKPLVFLSAGFVVCYYLPVEPLVAALGLPSPLAEALALVRWYAREHVLLCLVPAFFIAGAISVFISQASVMKYLGPGANKVLAYGVASVSGTILAVCSCTVLPLFAGIHRMGAGLGPATAFLYSGPAINVLAIVLTARVLGLELGIARAVGAVAFSIVIGLLMDLIFRREEPAKVEPQAQAADPSALRPLWQNAMYFASMVGILIFANWSEPSEQAGAWHAIYSAKWTITAFLGLALAVMLAAWFGLKWSHVVLAAIPAAVLAAALPGKPAAAFVAGVLGLCVLTGTNRGETGAWFAASWGFAKQILPLLLLGVVAAGLLLGRPGHEGLIPAAWVSRSVGGNSLLPNFAGPALSLPNMLVIHSVLGTRKTLAYVALVVVMATASGVAFGWMAS